MPALLVMREGHVKYKTSSFYYQTAKKLFKFLFGFRIFQTAFGHFPMLLYLKTMKAYTVFPRMQIYFQLKIVFFSMLHKQPYVYNLVVV